MEDYIQISKINDFIFCPRSLYFHASYEEFSTGIYHDTPQTRGKIAHEAIDKKSYSTKKKFLQGATVYSEIYGIVGKIDLLDQETNTLIERKYKVTTIYDGYRYQLYAQYLCLKEMGYKIDALAIRSLADNKTYPLSIPGETELSPFLETLEAIRNTHTENIPILENKEKCARCIYKPLCH